MREFNFVNRIIKEKEDIGPICMKLPERATSKSAGYDFFCIENIEIKPYKNGDAPILVPTGIKAKMEENEFLMIVNRSSNPKKKGLVIPNGVGIIDSDYYENPDNDGEIMFAFYNLTNETVHINSGDKIGQGIFIKYEITDNDNAQGERLGGFGSTGK